MLRKLEEDKTQISTPKRKYMIYMLPCFEKYT